MDCAMKALDREQKSLKIAQKTMNLPRIPVGGDA
jgi:hypothetical protein